MSDVPKRKREPDWKQPEWMTRRAWYGTDDMLKRRSTEFTVSYVPAWAHLGWHDWSSGTPVLRPLQTFIIETCQVIGQEC